MHCLCLFRLYLSLDGLLFRQKSTRGMLSNGHKQWKNKTINIQCHNVQWKHCEIHMVYDGKNTCSVITLMLLCSITASKHWIGIKMLLLSSKWLGAMKQDNKHSIIILTITFITIIIIIFVITSSLTLWTRYKTMCLSVCVREILKEKVLLPLSLCIAI